MVPARFHIVERVGCTSQDRQDRTKRSIACCQGTFATSQAGLRPMVAQAPRFASPHGGKKCRHGEGSSLADPIFNGLTGYLSKFCLFEIVTMTLLRDFRTYTFISLAETFP